MRSSLALLILLLGWMGTGALAAEPDSTIWTGLLLATNVDHPREAPPELRKYQKKLSNIFGYNQFELVGQQTRKMQDSGAEHWLVPSKDFCLHMETHPVADATYRMQLELFQTTHRLAQFETKLGPDSPLFIRGPLYAGGQLIIVLVVRDPDR